MSKLTIRPDTPPFGRRMTERMIVRGVDDQDVTDATGLSYDTVRAIRRLPNKNPKLETVAKIAEFLGVSTDWLFHGTNASGEGNSAKGDGEIAPEKAAVERVQRLKRELVEAYAELTGDWSRMSGSLSTLLNSVQAAGETK
jgi:transcriptional regulator with XRE-family HTH domain